VPLALFSPLEEKRFTRGVNFGWVRAWADFSCHSDQKSDRLKFEENVEDEVQPVVTRADIGGK
jgi:hypothetical protein